MLNGIMLNVSEREHELIKGTVEHFLTCEPCLHEDAPELEELLVELEDCNAMFNPELDVAERQQVEIQRLHAIIEKHERTIGEQVEMLKVLAIQIRQLGSIALKEWNKASADFAKRYPNITRHVNTSDGSDIIKRTFDSFTRMDTACRSRCEQVGMYLWNQRHDS